MIKNDVNNFVFFQLICIEFNFPKALKENQSFPEFDSNKKSKGLNISDCIEIIFSPFIL